MGSLGDDGACQHPVEPVTSVTTVTTVTIPSNTQPVPQADAAATSAGAVRRWGSRVRGDIAGFVTAATLVVVMSSHNGSYFSTSWGWQAMALLALGVTGLAFMVSVRIILLQALFLAGLAGFVFWVALSALWSESVPGSVREIERDVVYVGLALALMVFGRYLSARGLALGLFAGLFAVAAYSLSTRLFPTHFAAPDPIFEYRLSVPLGYWNGLGLFMAMGLILSIGIAGQGGSRVVRMTAGASTCVFAPAMLFTFSRGAWMAAAVGLTVMIFLDTRRIPLTAAAVAIAVPVGSLLWLGLTSTPLTDSAASVAEAARSGRRYAVAVILLACLSAILVELTHRGVARLGPGPAAERRFAVGLALGVLALVSALVIAFGGPVRVADRGWAAFSGGFNVQTDNLSGRFRSISAHGRIDHWRVALDDYRAHPVLGSGAGTYEQAWYRMRSIDVEVRDAHSLYLEVLAELGPMGLLLLLCAVAIPFVGFVRFRSVAYVPGAAGAFAAFAVHAAIDWDWEVVGLTAAALLAATVGLVAGGSETRLVTLGRRPRVVLSAAALGVMVFACVSFLGNREVAASKRALRADNPDVAAVRAEQATRVLRWSVEPWLALGNAQNARRDVAGARSSFEHATTEDSGNWRAWLALSEVTKGAEHRQSLRALHRLNPRQFGSAG